MSIDRILGIVGVVLGIVGIILGYTFYIRGREEKDPCFSLINVNLIKGYSSLFKDLKIKYKQKEVENLTVTKIAFWNNGNETIDRRDIETTFPLMIAAYNDTTILDINILQSSNPANKFSADLAKDQQYALLRFDYLNSQDGAVIQIIHTGVSPRNLWVTGEIKGVKTINYKFKEEDAFSKAFRTILRFYGIATLLMVSIDIYNSLFLRRATVFDMPLWFLIALWLGIVVVIVLDMRLSRRTARIPKELSLFHQDIQNTRIK